MLDFLSQDDIDSLMEAIEKTDDENDCAKSNKYQDLAIPRPTMAGEEYLDTLLNVKLDVSIELGRAQIPFGTALNLSKGKLICLDRYAGEPCDILINGKIVAKGEVVVIDNQFGVRVIHLLKPEERLKELGKK